MAPTKEEQINALVMHQAYKLVTQMVPPGDLSGDSYKKVFTVKRNEILNYAKAHFSMEEVMICRPGECDGFYVLSIPDGFEIYYQERLIKVPIKVVGTSDDVWEEYVDYLIRTSGTGLDFS